MAQSTLLISAQKVKELTLIDGNTDPQKINVSIRVAQDTELAFVLGRKLLDKLQSDFPNFTSPYDNLFTEFVVPYLAHAVAAGLERGLAYAIGNNGVIERITDQGNAVAPAVLARIGEDARRVADAYKQLLTEHLCLNSGLYPEYNQYQEGKQRPTDRGTLNSGIYFY